ncbi:uncharacterized protein [Rutidosis leptorrhynchoides]|uniref:uncharacterized protein n=1 Tax=Rutidosis leptorrhynchoides TaxID=125765 RepID=UPI003A99AE0F
MESIWGDTDFNFIQKPKIGKSGGMFLIWDTNVFTVTEVVRGKFYLAIKGRWKDNQKDTIITNVYGPHNDVEKKEMWVKLESLMEIKETEWVLCGDFNEKYTRISDNGMKLSKLDHFLGSECFLQEWGDLSVTALDAILQTIARLFLVIQILISDQNRKDFDIWFDNKDVEQVIVEAWNKIVMGSRDDCRFKYKMKNVKNALRSWSKEQYGDLDITLNKAKEKANELEKKAEIIQLNDAEKEE